jgi:TonB family protein
MAHEGAILVLLFAWCANVGAQEPTGKIIFYRESHFRDYDYKPLLYCDGFELARMVNGSYLEVTALPGQHLCVVESEQGPSTTIEIVPGRIVYEKIEITPTLKRRAFIASSEEAEFARQKKLNRIATAELDSVQPLRPVGLPLATQANTDIHETPAGGAEPEGVLHPGTAGVGYPRCVYCPDPKYTEKARHDKVEGTVQMRVVIETDGKASNIEIVKGLRQDMDLQAVSAVQAWRFEPARGPNGEPVAVIVPIEMTFRLLK